tara:strand:- start:12776 stop:13213 length:438 start_codon:yes stop_codon:yes gene_type:complete
MRHLYKIIGLFIIGTLIYACGSTPVKKLKKEKEEPVVIANDSLEYEITIIDPGFNFYLNSIAKPVGFYSQSYMERWNRIYVLTWNMRHNNSRFDVSIYENRIAYDSRTDYGMDVNYKLFNYFQFAQRKYRMRLDGQPNRIPSRVR